MKVFLDANFIVALLTKEASVYKFVTRILSASGNRFQFFTSNVCIAIAFYFASKKYSQGKVRADIELLVQYVRITHCGPNELLNTLANKQIGDIEDGLEYYAALESGCNCIITEDLMDFFFSEIEVVTAENFVNRYLLFRK